MNKEYGNSRIKDVQYNSISMLKRKKILRGNVDLADLNRLMVTEMGAVDEVNPGKYSILRNEKKPQHVGETTL